MTKKRIVSLVLVAVAMLITIWTTARTAYEYGLMLACVEYGGCSAPAYTAFFVAIPYAVIIVALLGIAHILWWGKKKNKE